MKGKDEPLYSNVQAADFQKNGPKPHMRGKENAEKLLKKFRSDFYKNVPFDRGMY